MNQSRLISTFLFLLAAIPLGAAQEPGARPLVKSRSAQPRVLPGARAPKPWRSVDGSASPSIGLGLGSAQSKGACSSGDDTTPPSSGGGSGSFSLKVYQGYQFSTRTALDDYTAPNADFGVSVYVRAPVEYARLRADKIEEFKQRSDALAVTASQAANWYSSVEAPTPEYYYMLRGKDGRYYLLRLTAFENSGMGKSNWKLTFTWEEVQAR